MAPEPVLIMMAHLTAYKNVHGGGFKNFGKSASPEELLIRTLSTVLVHGPVFLEGIRSALLRVVLLHDVETLASNSSFQGVELRYSARGSSMPGNDARWGLFRATLAREQAACTFTVDLGDAYPTTAALHQLCDSQPEALWLASDTCRRRGAWGWLDWSRRESNFTASKQLNAHLLESSPGRTVYNCGIMGGRRAVLLGALERMAYRIGDHYDELEARQIRPRMIVDMLAMHEMILELAPKIMTGFPFGNLNLPMHGDTCYSSQCGNRSYPFFGRPDCNRVELGLMTSTHYFRHKLACGYLIPCGSAFTPALLNLTSSTRGACAASGSTACMI